MIDNHNHYCVLYLLKSKSEIAAEIEEYVAFTKSYFGRARKVIRSDHGGEYTGKHLRFFYSREVITAQYTAGYSPQQNGIAESKNRSRIEMLRCMLFDAELDQRHWTGGDKYGRIPPELFAY